MNDHQINLLLQFEVVSIDKINAWKDKGMMQFILSSLLALFLVSCASAPQPAVSYVEPGAQGSVAGTGIESQDIAAASQKAAQSILGIPAITQASTPPTVLITPVANRSSSPVDTTLYTTKLRGTLMQYANGKVRFLARDASAAANEREQALREAGQVQGGGTAETGRSAATYDYILTAELQGISAASSKGQSDYFLVAFKLVDFNDMLIWENQYEIKKEGRESAVYR
ncbi:MAG: penicillin-binding protein activator LpoB [bacterium]